MSRAYLPLLTSFIALVTTRAADPPPKLLSPADAIPLAAADVAKLSPGVQVYTRYLWVGVLPTRAKRQKAFQVLSGHLQQLSAESDIVPPVVVPGSDGALIRLNASDYGDKWPDVWEQLADVEPYFHVRIQRIEEVDERRGYPDGKGGYYDVETVRVRKKVNRAALAPWLVEKPADAVALKQLVELTQSAVPVVDGRWFLAQTAAQTLRKPGYYDFLGIKDRKDYERLIGFDQKAAEKAKFRELLEAVSVSGISRESRLMGAFKALSGWYWRTFDQVDHNAVDERDPLEVIDFGVFQHDAEEAITLKANGFLLWGLFKFDGTRQDSAPDGIGYDHEARGNNGKIEVCVGCLGCHYGGGGKGGSAGIIDPEPFFRNLQAAGFPLQTPDKDKIKVIRQQYARDIRGPAEDTRRVHDRAVFQATGLTADKWAGEFRTLWSDYEDRPVTGFRAARDLGLSYAEFRGKILDYRAKTGSVNPTLAALISGQRIGIRQWEKEIVRAQLTVRGYVPLTWPEETVSQVTAIKPGKQTWRRSRER